MADANTSLQMLGQAQGLNLNMAALIKAVTSAFVGNAYMNSFTMSATASKTVTDANVKAAGFVMVFPLNAAAGTLQGSAKCLYTTTANGSFTAATASGGNAAGTELFGYLVLNLSIG